jgi:hypothetical protein
MAAGRAVSNPRSDSQFRGSANQKRGNRDEEVYDVCVFEIQRHHHIMRFLPFVARRILQHLRVLL